MICSNSSLPIANFDSSDIEGNPYFPLETRQEYWLSTPKTITTCTWEALDYVAVPVNATDIKDDIFTDDTEDRYILQSYLQLPNCDIGTGAVYNIGGNSTAVKYNETLPTAFAREFESCRGKAGHADDMDLVVERNEKKMWRGTCNALVSTQQVRQYGKNGHSNLYQHINVHYH